ncbi:hypothetical protein NXV57_16950 [Bacteroides thetaiotaomicron]|nr:hypothetical protein [Bacteroides thetaiotaomicron]
MDINDIIDSIYKLPDASKEALLSDAPEVAYPKGFHLFRANHKSSKFYLMKKGMLHAYTHQSDKKGYLLVRERRGCNLPFANSL